MAKLSKKNIRNFIPKSILKKRRSFMERREIDRLYNFDKSRMLKSNALVNEEYKFNNLRGDITLHYHSIEKGLSNANMRLGFGKKAFNNLFNAMDEYLKLGYPTSDERFQQACSVLKAYVDFHKAENFDIQPVQSKIETYMPYLQANNESLGGVTEIPLELIPKYSELNFKELAENRHSLRDFGIEVIDNSKVYEAIQIATKTPSVCNRQAYKTYQVINKEILEELLQIQGGLTTNGQNLQQVILVTGNREFMRDGSERNQAYIDGGMFVMSLVYALTYEEIATCILNANFSIHKEKSVRNLLKISDSEDIIAFIALGSFAENNKFAKSPRDNFEKILEIIK